jgi:hypothetical protein
MENQISMLKPMEFYWNVKKWVVMVLVGGKRFKTVVTRFHYRASHCEETETISVFGFQMATF